ncbi:MAG: hypothetical protein PHC75_00170 [Burkholderiales bacterium]|nr:hypothetical protein [Burkholderiales bacterium]
MYIILNKLKLVTHSGKTKTGKLIAGFDFLGFNFTKNKLTEYSLASYISYISKFKTKELVKKGHNYSIHFRAWLRGWQINKKIQVKLFMFADQSISLLYALAKNIINNI